MHRMIATTMVSLALIASAAAGPVDEVRCREIGFSKSVENRDIEAFRSFVDADARFISNRPRRGVDEIAEGWSTFMAEDGPRIRWRPQYVEVLEDGTLALSRGLYEYVTTAEDGTETRTYGSFNSTWRLNADGVWRVVFDAGDPAARPPTDEEKAILDQEDAC
ncbi:MAG: YybH family protein [Woeseiaceae bacterium]